FQTPALNSFHMTSIKHAVLALVFLWNSPVFAAPDCLYQASDQSLQIQWTAFKTSDKVPVPGSFGKVTLTGKLQAKTLPKLLEQLRVEIPISGADSIKTNNPARDQTLYDHFFKYIRGPVKAGIKKAKDGTFDLQLTLNGKTKSVPFKYTWTQ